MSNSGYLTYSKANNLLRGGFGKIGPAGRPAAIRYSSPNRRTLSAARFTRNEAPVCVPLIHEADRWRTPPRSLHAPLCCGTVHRAIGNGRARRAARYCLLTLFVRGGERRGAAVPACPRSNGRVLGSLHRDGDGRTGCENGTSCCPRIIG